MENVTEQQQLHVSIDFEHFPDRYTCKGDDVSPRVRVSGAEQPFLALIVEDPDAPEDPFVHWVIWNISSGLGIPENVSKVERPPQIDGAVQGSNTGLSLGYYGPCPPRGQTHRYFFKVYGVDGPLDLPPGATREDLLKALAERSRQYGEAMATFRR